MRKDETRETTKYKNIYENDAHRYRDFTDGNVTGVWSLVISAERR